MIPELIKHKIDKEADRISSHYKGDYDNDCTETASYNSAVQAAEYGYSLAESEIEKWRNGYNTIFNQSKNKIEEQDFGIERLKGLIETIFRSATKELYFSQKQVDDNWGKIKQQNNL